MTLTGFLQVNITQLREEAQVSLIHKVVLSGYSNGLIRRVPTVVSQRQQVETKWRLDCADVSS